VTPEQRVLRAKLAANSRWARPFAREAQAEAMRAYNLRRLREQVDPHGLLPDDVVEPLVRSAAKAHAAKMQLARAKRSQATS
jgi:hypothetical protein